MSEEIMWCFGIIVTALSVVIIILLITVNERGEIIVNCRDAHDSTRRQSNEYYQEKESLKKAIKILEGKTIKEREG